MQNILRFALIARQYPGVTRHFIVSQLLLLVTVIFQLLIPFLIRIIIDEGIAQRDMELVFTTAFWMAIFSLIAAVTSSISAYYSVDFAVDAAHEIRVRSYEKIGTLSFGNLDRFQTSDLLVRLTSDVNIFKQMVMYVTFFFFRSPFTLIGAIVLVLLTSPALFWIMAVVLLFTAVLMWIYAQYAQPLYTAVQTKLDWLNRVLQENLAGVRVVKAFVRAEHEEGRFDDRNVVLRETAVKPMRLVSFLQPALFLVLNLGTIAALWFGGDLVVNQGDATVGEIITFTNYLLTAMIPMVLLAVLLPEIARAEASMKRIFQVIDTEPDVKEKPDAKPMPEMKGHVVFENVSLSYLKEDGTPTHKLILKNINLEARPGEMMAFLRHRPGRARQQSQSGTGTVAHHRPCHPG